MSLPDKDLICSEYLDCCACFDEEVINDIINVLKETATEGFYYTEIAKNLNLDLKYVHLILILLDKERLTEHGSSVRGSWIDDKGREFLEKLQQCQNQETIVPS